MWIMRPIMPLWHAFLTYYLISHFKFDKYGHLSTLKSFDNGLFVQIQEYYKNSTAFALFGKWQIYNQALATDGLRKSISHFPLEII